MSWKTIATVLIVVFALALVQASLAGPMVTVQDSLNESAGDIQIDTGPGQSFDGNSIITGMMGHWFNMGLVAMFGIMAWATARVVRKELTQGRI